MQLVFRKNGETPLIVEDMNENEEYQIHLFKTTPNKLNYRLPVTEILGLADFKCSDTISFSHNALILSIVI